ncbi:MAG: hypothetical protein IH849_02530 [Acidobacteria bacterium]|nr:hypothetical protein [Acidobacteriota bacterium]
MWWATGRSARAEASWGEGSGEQAGSVVVTEGFIGATPAGVPTTMGFEASDLTASLLGAALEATEIQIWTDVPGMLTTGHPAVVDPRIVPRLTFDEAAELALFGAKVLHPDTIAPARERNIPVRILHSSNPDAEGTWITSEGSGATGAKSIAVTEELLSESGERLSKALGLEGSGRDVGRTRRGLSGGEGDRRR